MTRVTNIKTATVVPLDLPLSGRMPNLS